MAFSTMPETEGPEPLVHMDYEVMFFDTDCGGVVHNLAYLRVVEAARTKLGQELGLPVREMADRGEYTVVLRTEADYLQPARLGDHLLVEGWLQSVDRLRFWVAFRILRPEDDALLLTCRQRMASITIPSNKPLRPPVEWRDRFPYAFESA